ncbi:MAG: adaptor protein MecA [Lachnospiraceae bacterium]|nr:adaptor protein MecA [Lachnospiraceae bacterium]
MKIEKVNDHQIRCTLTKADLADRELKLSELAYGTEKAKNLFRDMMQQAALKFGFEAEDIPLMIEAIPLSGDCIVLIITKVEDPEELDTRFSKFAPSLHDGEDGTDDLLANLAETADDVLDLFKKIRGSQALPENDTASGETHPPVPKAASHEPDAGQEEDTRDITKMFSFDSLRRIIQIAPQLTLFYHGNNSLYKNARTGKFMLLVSKSGHTPEDFNKVCNILSEYGHMERYGAAGEAYMAEHFGALLPDRALQCLTEVNQAGQG